MKSALLRQVERIARDLQVASKTEYDDLPTKYFWWRDLFLVEANHAGDDAATVEKELLEIQETIDLFQFIRNRTQMDALDLAIFISRFGRDHYGNRMGETWSAEFVADVIDHAFWRFDSDIHSEATMLEQTPKRDFKKMERDAQARISNPDSRIMQIVARVQQMLESESVRQKHKDFKASGESWRELQEEIPT